MSNQRLSVERRIEVWEDTRGYRFEIGPDRDGLDLVTLTYVESDGTKKPQIYFTKAEALAVVGALQEIANGMED